MRGKGSVRMTATFSPEQGEITAQLEFSEASFTIFSDVLRLGSGIFKRLSPFGLRLSDLKFSSSDPSYAEARVTCSLYAFMGELNVKPDRIEIRSFDLRRRLELFSAFAAAADAVTEHSPDVTFRALTSSNALHGTLDGISTSDFLAQFVKAAPESLGAIFSTGVAYYFAPAEKRLMSSLTLEPSQAIEGGLFFRSLAIWDPTQDAIKTLQELDRKYHADAFDAVGISFA